METLRLSMKHVWFIKPLLQPFYNNISEIISLSKSRFDIISFFILFKKYTENILFWTLGF